MTNGDNDVDLEIALDGLQAAERYCSDRGLDDLARRAARLYQDVGKQAPDGDWGTSAEEIANAMGSDKTAEEAWEELQALSDEVEWDVENMLGESIEDDEFDGWDETAVDPREERDE